VTSVLSLVELLRAGGDDADDAARTIGLLLERDRLHRRAADEGSVDELLDEQWRERRIDAAELQAVVDALIDYIRGTSEPLAGAVWALSKSYQPRIVPPLIDVLRRTMAEPASENVAYLALSGVLNASPGTEHRQAALAVVREAAITGGGRVAETARQYLHLRG
jgi:hypothetical protein